MLSHLGVEKRSHAIFANKNRLLLQQDRYRSISQVRHREVEFSIAIEIGGRDLVRSLSHCIRRTGCLRERPIAIPQEESDRAVRVIGDREIQLPIVIEIPRYDRVRLISYRDWRTCGIPNVPSPFPGRISTRYQVICQTARSSFPSPSKSAVTIDERLFPTALGNHWHMNAPSRSLPIRSLP